MTPPQPSIQSIVFEKLSTKEFQTTGEIHNAVQKDYLGITAIGVIRSVGNLCTNGSCIREDPKRRKWQRYKKVGAAPMTPPNCDTCEHCDKSGLWWYCNIADISIDPLRIPELLDKVGCASHSSRPALAPEYCIWTEDSDGIFETSCGESWFLIGGNPESNRMKYCPYCGGKIREEK